MSDAPHEPHHRPHSQSMADPFMEFDLAAEVHRLQAETTWSRGQNARTLVKYDDLRVVLTASRARNACPSTKRKARITIHVLSGHIQVKASGRSSESAEACSRSIEARPTTSKHWKTARS